jgi:predicted DNA-binding transcriptional regulator YafY
MPGSPLLSAAFDRWRLQSFRADGLLIAWCPDRNDFRVFRLDRMERVALANTTFTDEAGRDLEAYLLKRVN